MVASHLSGPAPAPTPQVEKLYKRSRLISLSEWIVHSVLKIQGRNELLNQDARKKAADMVVKFDSFVFEREGGNGQDRQPISCARTTRRTSGG